MSLDAMRTRAQYLQAQKEDVEVLIVRRHEPRVDPGGADTIRHDTGRIPKNAHLGTSPSSWLSITHKTLTSGALPSQHGATMHSPSLVDAEGFPRADLDVPAIRTARTALIRAKNDRDALVDELARCLEVVHRRRDEEGVRAVPASTSASRAVGEAQEEAERLPFARVNTVASGSPAEQAVRPLNHEDVARAN